MKKGNVLLFALTIIFLIILGVGIYYYLNQSGKIDLMINKPPSPSSGQVVPTPIVSIEEDVNSIQISTDDAELQELNVDVQGL